MTAATLKEEAPAPRLREPKVQSAPTLGGWRFSIRSLPRASTGGDFYAFTSSRWSHELVVGYLAGAQERYAAPVRALLGRIAGRRETSPHARLVDCNAWISKLLGREMFCTAWCGVFRDDGSVVYASAGHEPPLLRRRGAPVVALPHGGAPFGFDESTISPDQTLRLHDGDALLAHTDRLRDCFAGQVIDPDMFAHFSNFERTLGTVAQGNDMLALVAERAPSVYPR